VRRRVSERNLVQDDLPGSQQTPADRQRPDFVVGDHPAGVADDMRLALTQAKDPAPSAYITNAAFFQAADELRTLQWIAYRAKSLSLTHGTHLANTEATRRIWETDEAWQPARETLERLLLAYDWGEAFTALNLVVKPAFDALFKEAFVDLASANGDGLTAALLQDSRVDTTRSQAWSAALARYALSANPANRAVIDGWVAKWRPLADRAVDGLVTTFVDPGAARRRITDSVAAFTAQLAE
jgi:toluene monooxygenase system protein E